MIVLNNYLELVTVISSKKELYAQFEEVFHLFSCAMKLMMARRFLTKEEINYLCNLCEKFGEIFPKHFHARNITMKIHKFVFNVPRFVKTYKTIGLLSEQEGESKHAAINAELQSLSSVRNHADRLRLVLEREELHSFMDKGLLKAKKKDLWKLSQNVFEIRK